MVKINIICVGKLKESYLSQAADEYLKRLSRFGSVKVIELAEKQTLGEEAEGILRASKEGYTVALAVEGKQMSSENFAKKLKMLFDRGETVNFLIGSSTGLDDSVKKSANELLSFSEMTFPHQLMRVILLEQIYRAFMINSNSTYHK